MKKIAKAMYGKSMMKNGGMKKMEDGGGVGKSKASGGKGSISDMTPNSSSGKINSPDTIYAPGKKKTESTKTYKTGGSTKYQKGGMTKANTMNPTSRNTAMTALGVKKKSNASSPSRFGENAVPTTGTKKSAPKKPLMKKGGVKKPLRKAQPGMAVGPYAASDLPPASPDKNIYAGPINEIEAKQMDEDFPSTVGKAPAMEGRGSKKTGYFSPLAVEASRRREDENYLRSNDPTVQKWNAIKNENKDQYPTTKKTDFKKGGSIKKMKTGGRVNPNAKVQASKTAGSKGVKSGANSKASASKVAKGRSGGTSKAPKTAVPKAKMGMLVRRRK